jgi:hypothetical protein
MADFELPEQVVGDRNLIPSDKLEELALQATTRDVSAIQPAYDLDRLTLAHERRTAHAASNMGSTVVANPEKVVLYIPDSMGSYSEERSIAYYAYLVNTTTVIFHLEPFAHQFPLRLDPCQCPGLISINSIAVFDTVNHRLVWQLDGRNSTKVVVSGTAVPINHTFLDNGKRMQKIFRRGTKYHQPLAVISTGLDPQLILPPLPDDVGFPLIVSVEMKLIPCG